MPDPKHYKLGTLDAEAIDVMEAGISEWPPEIAPHVFCALKYLLRAGKKDDIDVDLKKAYDYIGRALLIRAGVPGWPADPRSAVPQAVPPESDAPSYRRRTKIVPPEHA